MQSQGYAGYGSAIAVTPADATPITCRAIYVGGLGNIALKTNQNAAVVTFTGLPVGAILPVMIDNGAIMAATTATLLIALS